MNRGDQTNYIVKQINNYDIDTKNHITKILLFRDINVHQNNNGVHIFLNDIDNVTINDIYNYLKNKN